MNIKKLVRVKNCSDLLKVYSDKDALKLFNSDNCGDDNFYYTTKHRMKKAIDYWLWEYNRRGFCAIEENLVGHNGEIYRDYYALDINNMP